jgi:hypothetical protein
MTTEKTTVPRLAIVAKYLSNYWVIRDRCTNRGYITGFWSPVFDDDMIVITIN